MRESDSMNAQDVPNTLWAFAKLRCDLGAACDPLLLQVPRVATVLKPEGVRQVRFGLKGLQGQGVEGPRILGAWEAITNKPS